MRSTYNVPFLIPQNIPPPQTPTSGVTISSCPGLTRTSGKWWIPIGGKAIDCTYCDFCKNKYKIRGVELYKAGLHSNRCNCDSYRLNEANNIHSSLFNVSLWSRSLKTNYSLAEGHKSIFHVPTGKNFGILVDSNLPKTQAFKLKVLFYNSDDLNPWHSFNIQDSNGSENVFISSSILIRNHGGLDTTELKFIEKPESLVVSTPAWNMLEKKNINRIKLEITVFDITLVDVSKLTNTYLGSYKKSTKMDLIQSKNNKMPRLAYHSYDNIDQYSRPIIDESSLFQYNQITDKPITIEFSLKDTVAKQSKMSRIMLKNLKDLITKEEKHIRNMIKKETWVTQITGKTIDDNVKLIDLASKLSTLLEIKLQTSKPLITDHGPEPEPEPEPETSDHSSLAFDNT